jgi:hypothetical protein
VKAPSSRLRWPCVLALVALLGACGGEEAPPGAQDTTPPGEVPAETTPEIPIPPPEAPQAPAGDEAAVTQVVVTYFNALADRDYATACLQLGPEAQRDVGSLTGVRGDCEDALEVAFEDASDQELAGLRDVPVTAVEISGDGATVTIEGAARPVPLERRGDAWLISEFGGA